MQEYINALPAVRICLLVTLDMSRLSTDTAILDAKAVDELVKLFGARGLWKYGLDYT